MGVAWVIEIQGVTGWSLGAKGLREMGARSCKIEAGRGLRSEMVRGLRCALEERRN